jgi:hypothetical protein
MIQCFTAWLLFMAFVLLVPAPSIEAQEAGPVIECLPDDIWGAQISGPTWMQPLPLDTEDWENLGQLQGVPDVWVGYDNGGFDVSGDAYRLWTIQAYAGNNPIMVWINYSRSANEFYWFPFANIVPYADTNGDHYGPHPCGAFRVSYEDVISWLLGAMSNGE